MSQCFRLNGKWFCVAIVTVIATVFWIRGAQAATVNFQNKIENRSDALGRGFFTDYKYGDGSMKYFFTMLKIVLHVFGKH